MEIERAIFTNRKEVWIAECQWLMPVILAAWEAEIRRTEVKTSLGK
jgi:hypothetical protein